ncbi:methyltransferase domain-containing protein [Catellatospora coxensis]
MHADAFGPAYPSVVEPLGQCSLRLLGFAGQQLRLRPDDHLVDLGCGRGGPGLWLAQRHGARLTGVDFSPVAVSAARGRAAGLPMRHRPDFRHGQLLATGLADGSADAVVCIDALLYATDRAQALREVGRVLRPGGRAVVTVAEAAPGTEPGRAVSDWLAPVRQAGLVLRRRTERPGVARAWSRLYGLWRANAGLLRRELGPRIAEVLLTEATVIPPLLGRHRELVLTVAKP